MAAITDKILRNVRPDEDHPLRLLDVGSGEATVIAGICSQLRKRLCEELAISVPIFVDCIEPAAEGIEFINEEAKRIANASVHLIPRGVSIQDFLIRSTCVYDAILCCHSLYYVERSQWKQLLLELISKLDSRGKLIINLVSRQSDIYKIWDEIVPSLDGVPRMYRQYGFEYFAEDLEPILNQIEGKWETELICANICFPKREVSEAIKGLEEGSSPTAILDFLAFMYRIRTEDLRKVGKHYLLSLLRTTQESAVFQSTDKMLVFHREAI